MVKITVHIKLDNLSKTKQKQFKKDRFEDSCQQKSLNQQLSG